MAWSMELRVEGKSESTIKIRQTHLRSAAVLSRTARPSHLTADTLAAIYRRQDWAFDYRCDMRTSLSLFYEWAISAGLATHNPANNLNVVLS